MTFYEEMREVAEEMIAEFGMPGAIRRAVISGPDYDPEITETDYACSLVTLEYEDRDIDGTLVLSTDKKIYVSTQGLSITLEKSDRVIADGKAYAIERLKPLSPAGIVVFWEVQGRR
ncbi:hypothetical protein J2855_001740 [Agrobacterium tumefaciens]|uniref:hypothetical protein n=1 Tax=Agrobacterium tumefaciens TaxID=358 RepID=UPI000DD411F2|nr:hypothetical protein [Agrobacterium tumefaciens]MBP2508105.1 hypothetical protein [Agrobacterium tumefaciens]MBP2517257.1 hypothetical protein [Agrobacterium tumefaciens]MBP2575891.1 hypothetical protein [Agrobacterium tumefaciens]MBP2594247.1 hypothetical protein [Agrobacterium tumefaciens]